uniref:L-ascorbate peroxidase n=1 Tax=Rhizophora mucronata TaxID=61149 RepID=A0A2P2JGS1_RHIMU
MSLSLNPICPTKTSLKWSEPFVASGRRPSGGGSGLSSLPG